MSFQQQAFTANAELPGAVETVPNHSIRNPADRMRFLALHLHDLRSLRWLPAQLFLIASPPWMAKHEDLVLTIMLAVTLLCTPIWIVWLGNKVRVRFGESVIAGEQRLALSRLPKPWNTPFILAVLCSVIGEIAASHIFHHGPFFPGLLFWILCVRFFAGLALHPTNLLERRFVKALSAIAVLALAIADTFDWLDFGTFAVLGLVLLANALYDYALLHRCAHAARLEAAIG